MKKSIVWLLVVLMLMGCASAKKPQPEQTTVQEDITVDAELAQQVKRIALTVSGVQDAASVVVNKEISIAVKVGGFDRLRLKSIRKEIHDKIKNQHQEYAVYVTTDKKLFKELQDLEQQTIRDKPMPPQQLKAKVTKINQDMQG